MHSDAVLYGICVELDQGIVGVCPVRLRLDSMEAVERFAPVLEAAVAALDGPCYLLVDLSNLYLAPRIRTYILARLDTIAEAVKGLAVWTTRPNPLTELVASTAALYANQPFAMCADEAAARAQIARWQAERATFPPTPADPPPNEAGPG